MGETIVFTSGKGGVGKTTTIANIGAGLSRLDKKVVMLDTDMGLRNLDVVMGLEEQINYNLLDLLEGRCRLHQALIRDKRFPNLYLIPASLKSIQPNQYHKNFALLIHKLKEEFDYCLIDCPAGIDDGFRFATAFADRAILLTTPHLVALKDAGRVLSILYGTNISRIELIINEYDEKLVRKKYSLSRQDIEELLDLPVLGTVNYDYKVGISQNKGIPVLMLQGKASKQFMNLARLLSQQGLYPKEGEYIYDFS